MKTYQAFIEWIQCRCGCQPTHGTARLFQVTKDPFKLAPDGMPDAAWAWACNFELRPEAKTVFIKAAQSAPPVGSLRCMKFLARSLGAEWLTWERLEEGKLVEKTFPAFHPGAGATGSDLEEAPPAEEPGDYGQHDVSTD